MALGSRSYEAGNRGAEQRTYISELPMVTETMDTVTETMDTVTVTMDTVTETTEITECMSLTHTQTDIGLKEQFARLHLQHQR